MKHYVHYAVSKYKQGRPILVPHCDEVGNTVQATQLPCLVTCPICKEHHEVKQASPHNYPLSHLYIDENMKAKLYKSMAQDILDFFIDEYAEGCYSLSIAEELANTGSVDIRERFEFDTDEEDEYGDPYTDESTHILHSPWEDLADDDYGESVDSAIAFMFSLVKRTLESPQLLGGIVKPIGLVNVINRQ